MFYLDILKKHIYNSDKKNLGEIKEVNVNYNTGKVTGLIVSSFLKFKKQIVVIDELKIENGIFFCGGALKNYRKNNLGDNSIRNARVYTESNDFLGRVKDFEINEFNWLVVNIIIKKYSTKETLVINQQQIVSMDRKKIIVKDLTIKEAVPSAA